jgi:hypothetical protein
MSILTPLDPYIAEIKMALVVIIIASLGFYISHLKTTVLEQQVTIVTLTSKIDIQNSSIANAGKDRDNLQALVNKSIDANKKAGARFDSWKKLLEGRPVASTCDEALINVKNTSKQIAEDWNKK